MEDDDLLVLEIADEGRERGVERVGGVVLRAFDVAAYVVCRNIEAMG